MNDIFKRQAEQFMNAAKDARFPESMQSFAEDSVAKSREAFDKVAAVTKDQAKTAEEVMLATQAGAKMLGTKVLDNTVSNATAAFDAAQAIARATSVPEAARLQMEFFQKQFAVAGLQTKELFDLSTRIAKQTFDTVNVAAAKTFDQAKKSG